jgi:hypothetical protein
MDRNSMDPPCMDRNDLGRNGMDPAASSRPRQGLLFVAFVAMGLLLAGCKSKVTTDFATDQAADTGIKQVVAKIQGLEFLKSDDSTATLEFSTEEQVNLTDYFDGNTVRLFTDEELPDGAYVGVRLLLDTEDDAAYVLDSTNTQRQLTLVDGDYATIDFSIDTGSTTTSDSRHALTLTLDLRQSLSSNDSNEYELKPVLRAVDTDAAGTLQGTVTASCAAAGGAAVYLFQGEDDTPDDIDSADAEPYATMPVTTTTTLNSSTSTYTVRFLPEATYTAAVACKGNQDSPTDDDDIDFEPAVNVEITEDKTTTRALD